MIPGLNHNVRYRGLTVHVQTEDKGFGKSLLTSHVFIDGSVIAERKRGYADFLSPGAEEDPALVIRRNMQELHKASMKSLLRGEFDGSIERLGLLGAETERPAPSDAPPPMEEPLPVPEPVVEEPFPAAALAGGGEEPAFLPPLPPELGFPPSALGEPLPPLLPLGLDGELPPLPPLGGEALASEEVDLDDSDLDVRVEPITEDLPKVLVEDRPRRGFDPSQTLIDAPTPLLRVERFHVDAHPTLHDIHVEDALGAPPDATGDLPRRRLPSALGSLLDADGVEPGFGETIPRVPAPSEALPKVAVHRARGASPSKRPQTRPAVTRSSGPPSSVRPATRPRPMNPPRSDAPAASPPARPSWATGTPGATPSWSAGPPSLPAWGASDGSSAAPPVADWEQRLPTQESSFEWPAARSSFAASTKSPPPPTTPSDPIVPKESWQPIASRILKRPARQEVSDRMHELLTHQRTASDAPADGPSEPIRPSDPSLDSIILGYLSGPKRRG